METGPAPLVAPPRRHGAPAAPSPPPRGSRAGPVVVVAPGPPVTTATSAPVTLVAPGEARPAWVPGPTQTSDSALAPAPTVTGSTEVGLTLEASPEALRAQVSDPEPLVPEAVAGAERSMALAPGADSPKTEEARTSPDPGPGTLTGTRTRTPSRTAPGALTAKPPLAPKPGTTVASGVTARVAAVTAGQVTSGHGAAASASTGQASEDPSGPGTGPSGTCEALAAVVTVTPAPEPAENSQDLGSTSSLGPGISGPRGQAPDTLSYLDSVSLMSGTLESLADDVSSMGSDSEINGLALRKTDKYGFLGGSQYSGSL